jgi:hypothetical protein
LLARQGGASLPVADFYYSRSLAIEILDPEIEVRPPACPNILQMTLTTRNMA